MVICVPSCRSAQSFACPPIPVANRTCFVFLFFFFVVPLPGVCSIGETGFSSPFTEQNNISDEFETNE